MKLKNTLTVALSLMIGQFTASACAATKGYSCFYAYQKYVFEDLKPSYSTANIWQTEADLWNNKNGGDLGAGFGPAGAVMLLPWSILGTPFALAWDTLKLPLSTYQEIGMRVRSHKFGQTIELMGLLRNIEDELENRGLDEAHLGKTDAFAKAKQNEKIVPAVMSVLGLASDQTQKGFEILLDQYQNGPAFCGSDVYPTFRTFEEVLANLPKV